MADPAQYLLKADRGDLDRWRGEAKAQGISFKTYLVERLNGPAALPSGSGGMIGEATENGNTRLLIRPDFGPHEAMMITKAASPQSLMVTGGAGLYEELGRSGLRHWGGFNFEEWLRELQPGRRAAEVYREMGDSDPILHAIVYAIEMLVRRVKWWMKPGGDTQADLRYAQWTWSVLNDLAHSWTDTVSEILSMLQYGYAWEETVFKQRLGESRDKTKNSRFDDGTIGLRKLALRSQDSLWKWEWDEDDDELLGMWQNPPPDYHLRFIPTERSLHFRTRVFKDNPEGRSIFRSCYRPWYIKKNIEQIEGIGVERDLAGLPILEAPENVDIWNPNDQDMAALLAGAKNVVSSIRRDEQEGVILPAGWKLSAFKTGGERQFDTGTIITRYENRMATATLCDFILLGQDKIGSYALASVKTGLFSSSLGSYLDQMAAEFNRTLIPRLFALNGFRDYTALPELCHGAVETIDLQTLGTYLKDLSAAGLTAFDGDFAGRLQNHLLGLGGLPQAPQVEAATFDPEM